MNELKCLNQTNCNILTIATSPPHLILFDLAMLIVWASGTSYHLFIYLFYISQSNLSARMTFSTASLLRRMRVILFVLSSILSTAKNCPHLHSKAPLLGVIGVKETTSICSLQAGHFN